MKMKRITVSNTLRTIYDWKCTQTYYQHDEEIGTVVVKEFYKFDRETPIDRIYVSYHKDLPISDETIVKFLDTVLANWLQCCFVDNNGHTKTIINSYEYMTTRDGVEMSVVFGTQYYTN